MSPKKVVVSRETASILESEARKGPHRLNDQYDIYLKKISMPSSLQSTQRSAVGEGSKLKDTDEVHSVLKRINKSIVMLEDREESSFRPSGYVSQRPLERSQRRDIDTLVKDGHGLLDDARSKRVRGRDGLRDGATDQDLKNVLVELKTSLVDQLSPSEKAYYNKVEKANITKRMNQVEDRIMDIIDDLNTNDKSYRESKVREDQLRDRYNQPSRVA